MTKVNVISGFLGAGKTTLIRKLLEEALKGEKVVLIENEFGEIGIDGGFLRDAGVEISEMNSGCICCSLVGDFGKALEQVMDQFHPDRILIEPSGVGKLSDVVRAVQGVAEHIPGMVLGCAVTVADATKCKVYMKNFGEFYDNQIVHAGAIILSRTQKLSEEKLAEVAALLREKNPQAPIFPPARDQPTGRPPPPPRPFRPKARPQVAGKVVHEGRRAGGGVGAGVQPHLRQIKAVEKDVAAHGQRPAPRRDPAQGAAVVKGAVAHLPQGGR